jgi:hypothetical protein
MSVNLPAQLVAGFDVGLAGAADIVSCELDLWRRAVDQRQRLAGAKSELGVEAKGLVVVTGLHQPDAGTFPLARAMEHVLHQLPADAFTLRFWVDRDRPDAGNLGPLVEKIAADDAAVEHGDGSVESGVVRRNDISLAVISADGKSCGNACRSAMLLKASKQT